MKYAVLFKDKRICYAYLHVDQIGKTFHGSLFDSPEEAEKYAKIKDDDFAVIGVFAIEMIPERITSPRKKFKRKGTVVEAVQASERQVISTRRGDLVAEAGDWILTGTQGETYPCEKEVFEELYEEVVEPTPKCLKKITSVKYCQLDKGHEPPCCEDP